mgnify:CR=1 FL=1
MKIINRNKNEKLKIVITGATSGIGEKLAKGFAENGYYVEAIGLGVIPKDKKNIDCLATRGNKYDNQKNSGCMLKLKLLIECNKVLLSKSFFLTGRFYP